MSEKEPKEREKYMRKSEEDLNGPPAEKEGLEAPRVTGLSKVKVGIIIFVIIVLIIVIVGISTDMFGLFSN